MKIHTTAVTVDRLVNARESASGIDRAIETIVSTTGRFNGKDVTNYLEAYKAKMLIRDISKDERLSGFPRVVTPTIHVEVLEVQAHWRNWQDFEG